MQALEDFKENKDEQKKFHRMDGGLALALRNKDFNKQRKK